MIIDDDSSISNGYIKLDPGFIPELGVDESLWQKMRSGSETNKGYLTDKIYQRPGGSILDWGGNWNDGKNVVGTVTEEGNTTPYGSYKFDLSGSVSNVFNIQEFTLPEGFTEPVITTDQAAQQANAQRAAKEKEIRR